MPAAGTAAVVARGARADVPVSSCVRVTWAGRLVSGDGFGGAGGGAGEGAVIWTFSRTLFVGGCSSQDAMCAARAVSLSFMQAVLVGSSNSAAS